MKIKLIIFGLIAVCFLTAEFEKILIKTDREETGSEIFQKMKKAIGNVELINNIHTLGSVSQYISGSLIKLPVEAIVEFPDKIYFKLEDKEFIIEGEKGWIQYDKGYFESIQSSDLKKIRGNLDRNLISIIKQESDYTIEFEDYTFLDDLEYAVLILKDNIKEYTLFINIKTYLPYKLIYNASLESGEISYQKLYLKFSEIDKIMIPVHTITYDEQGSQISENIIDVLEINIQIDPDLF